MKPLTLYKKLFAEFGPQLWWPVTEKGQTRPTYKPRKRLTERQRFEIYAGAILTQNTDWLNVMKALENLSKANSLSSQKIANARQQTIARLVKPSGYFNQKAKKLRLFCKYLKENYNCSVEKLFAKPLPELREELLSLHGIGQETADDILLYAAEKPTFVVDAYTTRFTERFFAKQRMGYVEVKDFFESQLPKDVQLFNEFHALLVEFGKQYCKRKPNCRKCFLKGKCGFAKGNN